VLELSDPLRAALERRIASSTATEWPHALEREHRACLIDGDNATLWYLGLDGEVYSADRDRFAPRLEVEAHAPTIQGVLDRARLHFPELWELYRLPAASAERRLDLLSPDGRFRARITYSVALSGYSAQDVTVVDLSEAASGRYVRAMELNRHPLALVRFLAPRRLLLVHAEDELAYELDFDGGRRVLREVVPALVPDDYAAHSGGGLPRP
jgi:hypothetical protein